MYGGDAYQDECFGGEYYDEEWDDFYYEEDPFDDPFYTLSCDTPGCIALPGHFASECHTAQDAADWHSAATGEPVPWPLREPFYTCGLLYRRLRYGAEVHKREWRFHLDCDVKPAIQRILRPRWSYRIWPRKCKECGRRWGECDDDCMPF